jgi:hypothetical protein
MTGLYSEMALRQTQIGEPTALDNHEEYQLRIETEGIDGIEGIS